MFLKNKHLSFLILSLIVLSCSVFSYRYFVLDVPLQAEDEVKSWTIEAILKFKAEPNKPIKASFFIPYMPPHYATLDEYFVSYNYGVITTFSGLNRETIWSKRRAKGDQSLYYRAIFRKTKNSELPLKPPKGLKKVIFTDAENSAIQSMVSSARSSSADIQTFAQLAIQKLREKNDLAKILIGKDKSNASIVDAAIKILNRANIHAMPVKGLHLQTKKRADLDTWLLVWNNKSWIFIDPQSGAKRLPDDFLVWQYGDQISFSLTGGKKTSFSFTISPTSVNALSVAKIRGTQTESNLIKYSLLQLPLSVQQTYKILLTVPVGAFIILLLRNFIGLTTFGTFMPVLVALAFRETHVIWGILLFSFIVSIGLLARFYLDQLKLLVVPRLASILTVVVFSMIFISILSQHLGIESGLSVALFPMVILTMVIERMCITWDERGALDAVNAGIGSLLAASICYLAMNNYEIQYLFFAFPELLLLQLALILIFGQYKGYRLFELFRFKALALKSGRKD